MSASNVALSTDGDGYLSQQCPCCNRRFKVRHDDSGKTLAHCPYCSQDGTDCWWTTEQVAYLESVLLEPLLVDATRELTGLNRPGSAVRFEGTRRAIRQLAAPVEPEDPMPLITFACCGQSIKHDGRSKKLRCIICGAPAAASES